jgi:hypothetical protein
VGKEQEAKQRCAHEQRAMGVRLGQELLAKVYFSKYFILVMLQHMIVYVLFL